MQVLKGGSHLCALLPLLSPCARHAGGSLLTLY